MKHYKTMKRKIAAYSLQELLIVLVIIGILLLLALPNLLPLISKTKSIEAQTQLSHIYTLQKQYFYIHSKYSSDLKAIDFEAPLTIEQEGSSNYKYTITKATANAFQSTATAVTDFDGDGIFNVWTIDQDKNLKETVKD